jgi:hypothetical protein
MLSAHLKNNFSVAPLNEQWLEIIIKAGWLASASEK